LTYLGEIRLNGVVSGVRLHNLQGKGLLMIVDLRMTKARLLMAILIGVVIAVCFAFGHPTRADARGTTGGKTTHVRCFGDSYEDNGRALRITTQVMNGPNPPADGFLFPAPPAYINAHWANGKTAVEHLAAKLHVGLTNYAVGNATSAYGSYASWLDAYVPTGLLAQVDTFKARLGSRRADPRAVYVVEMAGNDYFAYEDYALIMPGTVEAVGLQVVNNECETVRELAALGAKRFLVMGSENVALLPSEDGREAAAAIYTKTMNENLPVAMRKLASQLHVRIDYFSMAKAGVAIRGNAAKYGITELNTPYKRTWPTYIAGTGDPNSHFFWDEWHPTGVVQEALGRSMYRGLPTSWK
jgi:cholinesterase